MTIQEISELLDAKLAPINNKLYSIETDLKSVKTHIESINERLFKLEERMAKVDSKVSESQRFFKEHPERNKLTEVSIVINLIQELNNKEDEKTKKHNS